MLALLALGNRGDQRGKGGVGFQYLSDGAKVRWVAADSCIEGVSDLFARLPRRNRN